MQLGITLKAKPTFDFTAGGTFQIFTDYHTFMILAQVFEDTGVRLVQDQHLLMNQSQEIKLL